MTPQQKAAEQANERPWELLGKTEAEWNEMQADKCDYHSAEVGTQATLRRREAQAEARSRAADRGPGGGADERSRL